MRSQTRSSALVAVTFAALAALVGGCSTGDAIRTSRGPQGSGVVEVVNLTPYPWRLEFVASADGRAGLDRVEAPSLSQVVQIEPRATTLVELHPGRYEVTQRAVTGIAGGGSTQRFPLEIASGERLRWRLATLVDNVDAPLSP